MKKMGMAMSRRTDLMIARTVVVMALLASVGLVSPTLAHADIPNKPTRTWGVGPATITSPSAVKPRVLAILPVGDRIFAAGNFSSVLDTSGVSYPVSNIAVFSATTGQADLTFQTTTNNTVTSLATDGNGTVFLGGTFGTVNGAVRKGLAAVDAATGAVKSWAPEVVGGQVDQLVYANGQIYAGGNFANVKSPGGTLSQAFLAKLDALTGTVDTAWATTPNDRVRAVTVAADGTGRLFIGGDFTSVSGLPSATTSRLAKVSLTGTGSVDSGFTTPKTNAGAAVPVYDMQSDASRLYIAAAGSGGACAAANVATGALLWSDHTNGNLQSVRLTGGTLYCGGHFSGTGSFTGPSGTVYDRQKLAEVDSATGVPTTFKPTINSALGVWTMASDATHIFVGGDFSAVSGIAQPHFAMFTDVADPVKPQPPTALTAQPADSALQLSWSPPSSDGGSPLLKYKLYRSETSGGQNLSRTPLATLSKTVTSYTDLAVTNGTTYYYVIVATNAVGASLPSVEAAGTPSGTVVVVPPGPPTSVTAGNPPGQNHVQWNPPTGNGGWTVSSYNIYRGLAPSDEDPTPVGVSSSTSFDDVYGLSAGTTYYYYVTAVNSAGEGTPSAEVFTTATASKPNPPNLTASVVSGTSVQLDWTIPANGGSPITKYVILRNSIQLKTIKTDTSEGPTTYLDTTAASGTTYSYQVKAVNALGAGGLSKSAVVTTP